MDILPVMTRKTVALIFVAFALFATSPATAYCILNSTNDTLYATLDDFHPLADFEKKIKPGKQICCDWFDRRCNPTGNRGALVSINIQGHKDRTKWKNSASKKIKNRRKGRTIKSIVKGLNIPNDFDALFCVDGIKQSVRASAGGQVTITKSAINPGRLNCQSRDQFLRPVNALSRQPRSGRPSLITAPRTGVKQRNAPNLSEELMR